MKTAELTSPTLDLWVAKALGFGDKVRFTEYGEGYDEECFFFHPVLDAAGFEIYPSGDRWCPASKWEHGGPIIDRERMNFATIGTGLPDENGNAPIVAIPQEARRAMEGPTHLIAAMRAFVASRFGDTVPDEAGTR